MVFFMVQWDDEDSVIVIREAKLARRGDEDITQGMTIQALSSKNSKGRSIVYKATVLKVFIKWI